VRQVLRRAQHEQGSGRRVHRYPVKEIQKERKCFGISALFVGRKAAGLWGWRLGQAEKKYSNCLKKGSKGTEKSLHLRALLQNGEIGCFFQGAAIK
jgi:hypothetical protein